MPDVIQLLTTLHEFQSDRFDAWGGDHWFLVESVVLGYVLCFYLIPWTTDLMVNASAGLAAKYFGNKSRTLVINASTNNPELANMVAAFFMRKAGGVANPLGPILRIFTSCILSRRCLSCCAGNSKAIPSDFNGSRN